MKKSRSVFIVSLSLVLTASLTYVLTYNKYKREIEFGKNNSELMDVYDDVSQNFYKTISKENLCEYMIKGCLDACDEDYCSFDTSDMACEKSVNGSSSVFKNGYSVDKNRHDEIVVTDVQEDSQAEKMGLKANDVILKIDGVSVAEKGYYTAIRDLMGKDGTTMKLHIRRDNEEFDMDFIRSNVVEESEKYFYSEMLNEDILYIRFRHFDMDLPANFEKALREKEYSSIILDIRNNPGGETWCAARIFDYFAKDGNSVLLKYVRSGKEEVYTTSTDGKEIECDVVVLVNENTVSAAEILTAFFKDTGRGTVIGEKTRGKAIFQNKKMLENMLSYTYTAGYVYVNDLPNYDEIGIYPDITVSMDSSLILTENDIQLQKALEILG